MLAASGTCSNCGGDVPGDARTMGLCPRCLLGSALGAGSRPAILGPGFVPPEVDEIRHALPNLEILELLGRGGMGAVYRARQRSLERFVAVKLFPREAFDDPTFDQRFASEARILASLSHPNVVAAHEFGETDRFCYLVMELVEGVSLRERMAEAGALSLEEAVGTARQVCDALAYAHGRGIVHRDIKPENILLEGEAPHWRVRVADFGLARLVVRRAEDWSLTAPNRLMGTPDYMAPEQRQSASSVDHRADVYALGVVLYEMLAGRLPIGRFAPPTGRARVDRVVLRCLEPAPANRYADVRALRQELEGLVAPSWAGAHWPVLAAAGATTAMLLIAVLITLVARHKPSVDRAVAASQPATDRVVARANSPAQRHADPVRDFAPPVGPFPGETVGIARPRTGFADPPWPDWRGPTFAPVRTPDEFVRQATARHGPKSVVVVYIRGVPAEAVRPLCDHVKALSGAGSHYSSSSNGFVTVCLAPVGDLEALRRAIDFGTVTEVDPAKRTITVAADAKKLPSGG